MTCDELLDRPRSSRPPEEEALQQVAPMLHEGSGLIRGLDTLADDEDIEEAAGVDDDRHESARLLGVELGHERPVDLQDVDRQRPEMCEGGESRPEVVERDAHTGDLDQPEPVGGCFEIVARDAFSFYMGCVQLVLRERGGLVGVADPRRDGSAAGPEQ